LRGKSPKASITKSPEEKLRPSSREREGSSLIDWNKEALKKLAGKEKKKRGRRDVRK